MYGTAASHEVPCHSVFFTLLLIHVSDVLVSSSRTWRFLDLVLMPLFMDLGI